MTFEKEIVIDARKHLLGRLASKVAKELLKGQKIVCVRCEDITVSGSVYRNRIKYQKFLHKRMNTNPKRGPFHKRSPREILYRTVRGMVPYKTKRGDAAMKRLKVFEGVPKEFQKRKKVIVESALEVQGLKPHRKRCSVKQISELFGWHHRELIEELEEKRKERSDKYFAEKREQSLEVAKAKKECSKELEKLNAILNKHGYN